MKYFVKGTVKHHVTQCYAGSVWAKTGSFRRF